MKIGGYLLFAVPGSVHHGKPYIKNGTLIVGKDTIKGPFRPKKWENLVL